MLSEHSCILATIYLWSCLLFKFLACSTYRTLLLLPTIATWVQLYRIKCFLKNDFWMPGQVVYFHSTYNPYCMRQYRQIKLIVLLRPIFTVQTATFWPSEKQNERQAGPQLAFELLSILNYYTLMTPFSGESNFDYSIVLCCMETNQVLKSPPFCLAAFSVTGSTKSH